MQAHGTILRRGVAYDSFDAKGTITTNAASSAITDTAGDTGFVALNNTSRIPYRGLPLIIQIPGPITSTGTGTTGSTLTFTVTFSDDGTNAVAGLQHVSQAITVTFASNAATAPTANQFFMKLPEVRHSYVKVAWATTKGANVTTVSYGVVGIALEHGADTETMTDIG